LSLYSVHFVDSVQFESNLSVIALRIRKSLPLAREAFAEAKGFEPLVGCPTPVFKTGAFDHSATLPRAQMAEFSTPVKHAQALHALEGIRRATKPEGVPRARTQRSSPLRLANVCGQSIRLPL